MGYVTRAFAGADTNNVKIIIILMTMIMTIIITKKLTSTITNSLNYIN